MFKVRDNEPDYALLADKNSLSLNRYGLSIDKAQQGDALYGKSLNINGDDEIGSNPNRYKQHGFFFNADNCIASLRQHDRQQNPVRVPGNMPPFNSRKRKQISKIPSTILRK